MKPPDAPDAHDADAEEKHGKVLCYVCEADVTERKQKPGKEQQRKSTIGQGLMEISCEGTGFAGGGTNMTKREGVAFQC